MHRLTEENLEIAFKEFLLEAGTNTLEASKVKTLLIALYSHINKPTVFRTPAGGKVVIAWFRKKPYLIAYRGNVI